MASNTVTSELSKKTNIFGLKLWTVIGVCVGLVIIATLFLLWLWLLSRRRPKKDKLPLHQVSDASSKEIKDVKIDRVGNTYLPPPDPVLLTISENSGEKDSMEKGVVHVGDTKSSSFKNPIVWKGDREKTGYAGEVIMQTQDNTIERHDKPSSLKFEANQERGSFLSLSGGSGSTRSLDSPVSAVPEVSHLGWGHWYTLRELEAATDSFADSNVLGEGGYGIVYRGQLPDSTLIAVKNLLNNRGQAEKEFRVEVEAIGRVRHKNLVRLLGYCAEGAHR